MPQKNKGFTLVELSIVILIIGVLVAGITGGSKLLEQAELRGVISDMARYDVAFKEFKLAYEAIPGDFRRADMFFTGCAETNAFCGGNGDGAIEFSLGFLVGMAVADGDEVVRAFRHLYLAGIMSDGGKTVIPNTYADIDNWGNEQYYPKSKISGAGYFVSSSTTQVMVCFNGIAFNGPWTNADAVHAVYLIGMNDSGVAAGNCKGAIEPAKAFQIDKKIDDASEATGVITGADTGIVRSVDSITGSCTTGAAYDIALSGKNCFVGKNLK